MSIDRRKFLLDSAAVIAATALPLTGADLGPVISFRAIPECDAVTLPKVAWRFDDGWTIRNTGEVPLTIHGWRQPFVLRPRHVVTFDVAEGGWQISTIEDADGISAPAAPPAPTPLA